jgi:hypothetical protein
LRPRALNIPLRAEAPAAVEVAGMSSVVIVEVRKVVV